MSRIAVVGGGVAGLAAALKFGRAGHAVDVLERDPTPMPGTADEAFDWDRRGAPQVRHSHAFLARLYGLIRDHEPDVLAALLGAGATEMRFGDNLPPTITNFERMPGDENLVMLACRRTTFEWVLRRAALNEGNVTFRTGTAVDGLLAAPPAADDRPRVTGVRLADGSTVDADLVVVANGRRTALSEWVTAIGGPDMPVEDDDTGIVYLSRFYRLRDGAVFPPRSGLIGGDLGYLKFGIFVGDNRTFSLTLAIPSDDDDLRKRCSDPAVFEAVGRRLEIAEPFLDGRAEAITPVHVMAGLVNRWREFVVDGRPAAVGVHCIGDAVLCTNPLYGRGCTTGYWGAHLLAEAVAAHPGDPEAQARRYDAALREQIYPWYRASVVQDAEARRVAAALLAGRDPDGDPTDPRAFMRGVLREGLAPALRFDAVVLRAFVRSLNLLSPPDALMTDEEVSQRVLAVWQDREHREPEPRLGPATRAELLDAIAA